jgi:hypothetical protein
MACLDRREFSFECQNLLLRHVLETHEASSCLRYRPKQLISFKWIALESRFCVAWSRRP